MKFYVTGHSKDKDRIRSIIGLLEERGHKITHDWTHSFGQKHSKAKLRIEGVRNCDVLVARLKEPMVYREIWADIGIALALHKHVWVIGDAGKNCLFYHHLGIKHFANEADLFYYLTQFMARYQISRIPY
jgi:uncharacterized protein with ACT and thioredoxin-like domain